MQRETRPAASDLPPCLRDRTDVRKVYRVDADEYTDYFFALYLRTAALCCACPLLLCLPCEWRNLHDAASAVTVALTDTHLVYCREQVRRCWRLPPCDAGAVVREVPFEQITDVEVILPAGDCCPRQRLVRVRIQTAGRSGTEGPELDIVGLDAPDAQDLRRRVRGVERQRRRV